MLALTTMNDNDVVSKFKATIRILFVFSQIIVLIIRIRPNSQNPLFSTALIATSYSSLVMHFVNVCLSVSSLDC